MIEFFNVVTALKDVKRKGWIRKVNIKNSESVADHSYSMTVIAMILSDSLNLDTNKVMKMSLLHDLTESITGDLMPHEISKQEKIELENKTMSHILLDLPSELNPYYKKIWNEYQEGKTKEAVLVHETDHLEMALQAKKYQKLGYSSDLLEEFFDSAKKGIKNPELLKILDTFQLKK